VLICGVFVALVQFLEVVRIEGHAFSPEDVALARDMYLLQVKLCMSKFIFVYFSSKV